MIGYYCLACGQRMPQASHQSWTFIGNAYIILHVNNLGTVVQHGRPGLLTRAKERWRGFGKPTRRGFCVWGVVGLVIAVPEIWGSFGNPWFYSISRPTGHLEDLWAGVRAIVVALIAVGAVHAVLYRPDLDEVPPPRNKSLLPGRAIRRTGYGRLSIREPGGKDVNDKSAVPYLAASAVAVGLAGWLADGSQGGQYWRGYIIYGLIAVFSWSSRMPSRTSAARISLSRQSSPRSGAWRARATLSR